MPKIISTIIFTALLIFGLSNSVLALEESVASTDVVINEIQTNGSGSGTSNQEFIELTNLSQQIIDINGWSIEYVNTSGNIAIIHTFGDSSPSTQLYPNGYMLGICKDASIDFLAELTPKFAYNTCLAASGAGLVLKNNNGLIVDSLYWVSGPNSFSEDIVPLLAGGSSIQRRIVDEKAVSTGNNLLDFEALSSPTPQVDNFIISDEDEEVVDDEVEPVPTPEPNVEPTPDPVAEEQAEINAEEYLPILLSELYIDPADPLADSQDEWVEIYNPNNQNVDLKDYVIYTGSNYSYKYIFTEGSNIEAYGYIVVTSGESSLALSNTGGKAKIMAPDGQVLDETSYSSAKNGLAWAKSVDGVWSWSATPTQKSANVITNLPIALKTTSATVKKISTAKPKSTTTKASTKTTQVKSVSDENLKSLIDAPSPLPSWLLVTLGSLAVIYCLYEYRFEVSNRIYQLRHYRTNRR